MDPARRLNTLLTSGPAGSSVTGSGEKINLFASHPQSCRTARRRRSLALLPLVVAPLALAAQTLAAQTLVAQTLVAQTSDSTPPQSSTTPAQGDTAQPQGAAAQRPARPVATQTAKLALAPIATYDNKYEVYGGINFENFQAGQDLPKRMNFAGAEAQGTYWLRSRLGVTADYRFEGGTTPVFPNNYYNRVVVLQQNFLAGATYRGPKGRYAAVDYHALAGGSHGTFDYAFNHYPGGSPISATGVGLYSNRTAFMAALGGSVDFNYSKRLAVRLQPDIILEHYGTELREFVSVSGGIVYRIGRR